MRNVTAAFLAAFILTAGSAEAQVNTVLLEDKKSVQEAKRPEGGKYLTVDLAVVELEEGDLTESVYSSESMRRKGRTSRNLTNEKQFIEFSNEMEEQVTSYLVELDYLDTTEHFLPDYRNSLKLWVTVQEIHFDLIKPKRVTGYTVGYVEMSVDFELRSHYGKTLIKETLFKESDALPGAEGLYDEVDLMLHALVHEFLASEQVKAKVTFGGGFDFVDENLLDPISFTSSAPSSKVNDWREAVATIITDGGHGSACVISADGYLVTNFHVVEQSEEVRVKFMDGRETAARVVRKHPDCDLALLKAEQSGLRHLPVSYREAELGETVFVIGTPADTLLAQSVSRGIVSGTREYEGVSLIQTDAKVNGGNSGGALVSKDGTLIGIVSAKYVGYGIEGIGFAVPTIRLRDKLKVEVSAPASPVTTAPQPANPKGKKK